MLRRNGDVKRIRNDFSDLMKEVLQCQSLYSKTCLIPLIPVYRRTFLAGTRDGAYDLMAQKLGCGRSDFEREYLERYRQFFGVLDNKLRHRGLPPLGEGKDGFAPPF